MQAMGGQILDLFLIVGLAFWLSGCSKDYQEVTMTIEDFRITPDTVHLSSAQPVRLLIRNQGRELHQFKSRMLVFAESAVSGDHTISSLEAGEGIKIPSGQYREVVLKPQVGIYHFQCPIRGHRGMRGMFVVEARDGR